MARTLKLIAICLLGLSVGCAGEQVAELDAIEGIEGEDTKAFSLLVMRYRYGENFDLAPETTRAQSDDEREAARFVEVLKHTPQIGLIECVETPVEGSSAKVSARQWMEILEEASAGGHLVLHAAPGAKKTPLVPNKELLRIARDAGIDPNLLGKDAYYEVPCYSLTETFIPWKIIDDVMLEAMLGFRQDLPAEGLESTYLLAQTLHLAIVGRHKMDKDPVAGMLFLRFAEAASIQSSLFGENASKRENGIEEASIVMKMQSNDPLFNPCNTTEDHTLKDSLVRLKKYYACVRDERGVAHYRPGGVDGRDYVKVRDLIVDRLQAKYADRFGVRNSAVLALTGMAKDPALALWETLLDARPWSSSGSGFLLNDGWSMGGALLQSNAAGQLVSQYGSTGARAPWQQNGTGYSPMNFSEFSQRYGIGWSAFADQYQQKYGTRPTEQQFIQHANNVANTSGNYLSGSMPWHYRLTDYAAAQAAAARGDSSVRFANADSNDKTGSYLDRLYLATGDRRNPDQAFQYANSTASSDAYVGNGLYVPSGQDYVFLGRDQDGAQTKQVKRDVGNGWKAVTSNGTVDENYNSAKIKMVLGDKGKRLQGIFTSQSKMLTEVVPYVGAPPAQFQRRIGKDGSAYIDSNQYYNYLLGQKTATWNDAEAAKGRFTDYVASNAASTGLKKGMTGIGANYLDNQYVQAFERAKANNWAVNDFAKAGPYLSDKQRQGVLGHKTVQDWNPASALPNVASIRPPQRPSANPIVGSMSQPQRPVAANFGSNARPQPPNFLAGLGSSAGNQSAMGSSSPFHKSIGSIGSMGGSSHKPGSSMGGGAQTSGGSGSSTAKSSGGGGSSGGGSMSTGAKMFQ